MTHTLSTRPAPAGSALSRRLLPLHVAVFLQGVSFWVPVEKLFLTEIGFDAATIGVMAASYAALVPAVEVVSGVLADRWSRRGVLVLSAVALLISVLIGGIAWNVPSYLAAALVLGVFFGMYSGTVDAIVYDVVLEETGTSAGYARQLGRVRLVESAALVASAVAGGWLAEILSTRATYFFTLPFAAGYLVVLFRFREPRLHRTAERTSLRRHLAVTYGAIVRGGRLVPIAAASVLAAVILQTIYEFGPLWLLELGTETVVFGPFWATLVAMIGLGGVLAAWLALGRPRSVAAVFAVMLAACLVLTSSHNDVAVMVAQVVLAFLMVVIGVHASKLLHDAVPSTIRTGVASGVSAVSWLLFFPFALVFGAVSEQSGVEVAGWLLTGAVTLAAAALVWIIVRPVVDADDAAR